MKSRPSRNMWSQFHFPLENLAWHFFSFPRQLDKVMGQVAQSNHSKSHFFLRWFPPNEFFFKFSFRKIICWKKWLKWGNLWIWHLLLEEVVFNNCITCFYLKNTWKNWQLVCLWYLGYNKKIEETIFKSALLIQQHWAKSSI